MYPMPAMTAQALSGSSSKFQLIREVLALETPRGRLLVFGVLTLAIFFSHYHWFDHLSLWGDLGIHAPSVGLTRAYWLVLHGHLAAAWHRNCLIYLVLVVGLPLLALDITRLRSPRVMPAEA